jgi:hypothetical protein
MKRKTEIHGNRIFSRKKAKKCSGNWWKSVFFLSGQGPWPLQGLSKVKCLVFFLLKFARSKYDTGKWPLQAIFGGH